MPGPEEIAITPRIHEMLFDLQTTHRADFRDGEITAHEKTVYEPKKVIHERPPAADVKYVHTMHGWRCHMPMDAFWLPKPILRENPHVVPKPFERSEDQEKAAAIKSRPRLVMTPAVSMDDVDETARSLIIKEVYTSEMSRKMREAVEAAHYSNVKAPLPDKPAPADPISLPRLKPHYVSPEWRMETLTWDRKQLRSYCDTTRDFWLRPEHELKCRACEESEVAASHRRRRMMKH